MDFTTVGTADLLAHYRAIHAELKRRDVMRSSNLTGDYAEWVVGQAFGRPLEPNSKKGYDLVLDDGRKVQVKGRVVDNPPDPGQLRSGEFKDWDFDLGAFVLLDSATMDVRRACLIPVEFVRTRARQNSRGTAWFVNMNGVLMDAPEAVDITRLCRDAASAPTE
jgi:hypothetical protein